MFFVIIKRWFFSFHNNFFYIQQPFVFHLFTFFQLFFLLFRKIFISFRSFFVVFFIFLIILSSKMLFLLKNHLNYLKDNIFECLQHIIIESLSLEEDIIVDVRNLLRLKKELDYTAMKDIIKLKNKTLLVE